MARYGGSLITKDGVRFDPQNMEAPQMMRKPQNCADLVQNVPAVDWMRSAIPNYLKRVAPLQPALAKEFVAFSDPEKRICVLTGSSDRLCDDLVTQINDEQLDLPMEEQDHQPLAFLLGEFKGAQLRWTVPEKKCFAIVDTVTKMDYLLLSHDEFSILSDHLNLTYIYNPLTANPTFARHVVHKLQRWALKMSVLSYRMEHVMGELNYWTDLMTRWGAGWIAGIENKAHGKMASLFGQPYISPPDYDMVSFLSKKEILLVQQSAVN
jgi:hypothetical protein